MRGKSQGQGSCGPRSLFALTSGVMSLMVTDNYQTALFGD